MESILTSDPNLRKSWSSYHAPKHRASIPPPCNKSILPILKDVVHTFHMQHHLISLFINYTNTLNPQQITAVDCSDQPIYALSKINQWMCPDISFPRYFPLFGGLHIENALLIANGNLLGGSGLDNILGVAAIDTIGLETAVLDVNHIHKAGYSLQLSVVVIYACLKEAYTHSKSGLPLFTWAGEVAKSNHMFKYWLLILKFQMDYLILIRSLREGNFILVVNVLKSLVKWFFIFDQYNYARWITVHIQDLLTLPVTCPQVYQEFIEGKRVVQISNKELSRIHYDHAHEQTNKTIKSISRPINFVNRADDDLQRRWEVAGPEVAEYIEYVEQKILKDTKPEETNCHHEDNPSHNKMSLNDCGTIITRLLPITLSWRDR